MPILDAMARDYAWFASLQREARARIEALGGDITIRLSVSGATFEQTERGHLWTKPYRENRSQGWWQVKTPKGETQEPNIGPIGLWMRFSRCHNVLCREALLDAYHHEADSFAQRYEAAVEAEGFAFHGMGRMWERIVDAGGQRAFQRAMSIYGPEWVGAAMTAHALETSTKTRGKTWDSQQRMSSSHAGTR